jgi:hypothetical protein
MKKIYTLIAGLMLTASVFAQAPEKMTYQAVVRNSAGQLVTNQGIGMQISVLQGTETGTPVYVETHNTTTNVNGLVSIEIGNGTIVSGDFTTIDWANDVFFIKTETDPTGGTSYTITGTTQLMSVPYALSSADNQWIITGNDIENANTGKVTISNNLDVGTTINLELGSTVNEISIDGTLADNSDDAIPTEKAVKTYVDNFNNNLVTKIDDLSDGKSDSDGTEDGSSIFLGIDAGLNDDGTNNKNVGIGFEALKSNTTGFNNTANGYQALRDNTTGTQNTANGNGALFSNTTGYDNTANGVGALGLNTIGSLNTANGYHALFNNTVGTFNVANGHLTLSSNTTGNANTANGSSALRNNTTGGSNTANGFAALTSNTTGDDNTANGYLALYNNTTGIRNTANGAFTLLNNTLGSYNTAIGFEALYNATMHNSTAIGRQALKNVTTGSNNIGIGYNAQVPNATVNDQVRIGNTAITYAGVQVAWTVTSDKRWKENIRELPYGLDVVKQLKPVDYIRKNNEHKTREMGFIAQDVEALLINIGYEDQGFLHKDDEGSMSLRYNDFIALLTKAIQEQQEIIEEQNSKIESQNNEIKSLTSEQQSTNNRLNKIESLLNTSQQLTF